jgi:hypothetical protein
MQTSFQSRRNRPFSLCRLLSHVKQNSLKFEGWSIPPRALGMTWSAVREFGAPQREQTPRSRWRTYSRKYFHCLEP